MPLRPQPIDPVPVETLRVARAAFPDANPYLSLRAELGPLFTDADFLSHYSRRGKPAEAP